MRAVILATGSSPEMAAVTDRWLPPLLPLVDRPFVQQVVEYLAGQGVRDIDFVLCDRPELFKELLGGGERWGCRFRYHLARDVSRPCAALRAMAATLEPETPLLLGRADRLPQADFAAVAAHPGPGGAVALVDGRGIWTGWTLAPAGLVARLPPLSSAEELAVFLGHPAPPGFLVPVPRCLDATTPEGLLAAQGMALRHEFPGLLITGRDATPGVWLSRNVQLHPTAELTPPVFIGADCSIGPGVRLGPDAVIGNHCLLDSHSTVTRSAVLPHSYVGEGLELADAIVDRNLLVNARLGAALTVSEQFLLGNLAHRPLTEALKAFVRRTVAAVLLFLALPALLVTALVLRCTRRGPVFAVRDVLRLPASGGRAATFRLWSFSQDLSEYQVGPPSLRHLLLCFLPGLVNVVRGEMHLAGLPPRSPEEVEGLPRDWQETYRGGVAGLVSEAALLSAPLTEDDAYSADAYHLACRSLRYDLGLVLRYALALLASAFGPRAVPAEDVAEGANV
jgi:lipopolysaccharide/colanic/teichoic acid biosynthesis glycosyltransferase